MPKERNPYQGEIDFAELALKFPQFNTYLKRNGQLDFSDPQAVKQLTYSLLKRDFNLELELPDDRLCPPVPNRLNYILWIQDLLDTSHERYDDKYHADREVTGLDIGTGSSCIYPLLGCSQRSKWRFLASELDPKNLTYAQQNIARNKLQHRIKPIKSSADSPLIPLDEELGINNIDFCMTNPPFYASDADLLASVASKSRPPNSACTGAPVEMVCPGGEIAFVSRMIAESADLGDRVQWYSSMLGKLSSVGTIVNKLRKAGVTNWTVREFVQGGKTRRWGVAWSWADMRPSVSGARSKGVEAKLLPFPSEFEVDVGGDGTVFTREEVAETIDQQMTRLDLRWRFRADVAAGVGFAGRNVWSRAARRKKEKKGDDDMDENDEDIALGFRISCEQSEKVKGQVDVRIRWLQGEDHVLFESFCGMVKRLVSG